MKIGPITAQIRCDQYYAFSKSFDEYIPKYGGYTTTEFPAKRHKEDILWVFLTYTLNGKVIRRQTMVEGANHEMFRIDTTEMHETEEPL